MHKILNDPANRDAMAQISLGEILREAYDVPLPSTPADPQSALELLDRIASETDVSALAELARRLLDARPLPDAAVTRLAQLLGESMGEANLRLLIIIAGRVNRPETTSALFELAVRPTSPDARACALSELRGKNLSDGQMRTVQAILTSRDENSKVRVEALRVLANQCGGSRDMLAEHVQSLEPLVRAEAIDLLDPSIEGDRSIIATATADQTVRVRCVALDQMARIAHRDASALELIISACERDRSEEARASWMTKLNTTSFIASPHIDRLVAFLTRLSLTDPAASVRSEAQAALMAIERARERAKNIEGFKDK